MARKQKFEIPRSLRKHVGTDFDALIPEKDTRYLPEDTVGRETVMNRLRETLLECLLEIENVIAGKSIYRALKAKNLKETYDEILSGCNFGNHWTSCIMCADVDWDYGVHSGGFYVESREDIHWEDPGVLVLEAKVRNPAAINFAATIYPYFQFGKQESEIYIQDDSGIDLVRIGVGSMTGRARTDLIRKQEQGIVLEECRGQRS